VAALGFGALRAIYAVDSLAHVTVLDEGRGRRRATFAVDGRLHRYELCGERSMSRRVWRPESLWNIRMSSRIGGGVNPTARAILDSDAVLDVTGGDSFTDLYGARRFRAMAMFKQLVLEHDVPLILLPQTYGPFADRKHRDLARQIISRATMAWARDQRSYNSLRELLADEFDPAKHRAGVDMAFGLEPREPAQAHVRDWIRDLSARDRATPLIGINVSGLLYNARDGGAAQYGLRADYRRVIHGLIERLLANTSCRILLVPHVVTASGHFESDFDAGRAVRDALRSKAQDRVFVQPAVNDPREAKWIISQLHWFCGTRMHATIAALSSVVPAAAIAYSGKTIGVFDTCGQGNFVADLRTLDTSEAMSSLLRSFADRRTAKSALQTALPRVVEQVEAQIDQISRVIVPRANAVVGGLRAHGR
jgi:polysaccharide pyruvyl transferase WcaK-like protein